MFSIVYIRTNVAKKPFLRPHVNNLGISNFIISVNRVFNKLFVKFKTSYLFSIFLFNAYTHAPFLFCQKTLNFKLLLIVIDK